MTLAVHRATSVADLADLLARRLAASPPADPFAPVEVAVPSRGMERWLTQRLAVDLGARGGEAGVCANVAFPFPGSVVRRVLAAVLSDAPPDADPWAPQRLVWPLLGLLDDLPAGGEWTPLRAHLAAADTTAERRRFPLARRIADLFDRYALHRPDMVGRWSQGEAVDADGAPLPGTAAWQPPLWRALSEAVGVASPDARFREAIAGLRRGEIARPGDLPDVLRIFGVLSLPALHLDLLAALAEHTDVAVYAVAPCRRWEPGTAAPEPANPLLAACGMAARQAHDAFARHEPSARLPGAGGDAAGDAGAGGTAAGDDAAGDAAPSALALLQADVRADRRRGPRAAPRQALRDGDRSVQVHACHGPMRQLEVLREVLLGLLEDDPTLEPRDIVVLVPDVEAYDPLISAVLSDGGAPTGVPRLPFRVADRTLRDENVVAQALGSVLELVTGRVGASTVVDLLGTAPLRARFGLTPADLAALPAWVLGTGISWGIDAEHRRELIDLDDDAHTWHRGLDRLALGAAMVDDGLRMVDGVVPYDDVEGAGVGLLGRLATATDALFAQLRALRAARSVAAWRDALEAAIDALLDPEPGPGRDPELVWQVSAVREAIAAVVRDSAGEDGEASPVVLTLEEIRTVLGTQLGQPAGSAHYGTGAITFTGLVPLRNVPHRVVCLVGMDDGALPRSSQGHGFDLMAAKPEPGDPDPRVEDRQLLLDAVLAARDALVITYTGHDPRTNEAQQPAVPVSELLDVLDDSLVLPDDPDRRARTRLITDHPLQPHSPRYFRDPIGDEPGVPRAFDRRQLAAARTAAAPRSDAPGFFPPDRPLPPPGEEELDPLVVDLDDLLRFLDHPVRHLLQRRVGVALAEDDRRIEDRDPTDLDALERWKLGQDLLVQQLEGTVAPRWRELTLACGTVPVGGLGEVELSGITELVDKLCAEVEAIAGDRRSLPIDVLIDLPDDAAAAPGARRGAERRRLIGSVELLGDVVPHVSVSTLKAKHRLASWVKLLAVTAMAPELTPRARLLGKDTTIKAGYRDVTLLPLADPRGAGADRSDVTDPAEPTDPIDPPERARAHLGALLALYLRGHVEPVALLPQTSWRYACCRKEGADREEALASSVGTWEGNEVVPGEQADAYVVQAFGRDLHLDELAARTGFTRDAEVVWPPLLAAEVATAKAGR